jgi:hypothetical protein
VSQRIFVFGSNLAGVHGKGSAKAAATLHGAERGIGVGRTGNAYAIPTKASWRQGAMSLASIGVYVDGFIEYATAHPELTFDVVRIGCGLAGYEDADVAPLFRGAPENVVLPFGWRELAGGAS